MIAEKRKLFFSFLFYLRLLCAMQVYYFPSGASSLLSHPKPFLMLAVCGLLTSFTSTLMFTAMGSFFNRISDPGMGGAYLTLLNTIANMGESPVFNVSRMRWRL